MNLSNIKGKNRIDPLVIGLSFAAGVVAIIVCVVVTVILCKRQKSKIKHEK